MGIQAYRLGCRFRNLVGAGSLGSVSRMRTRWRGMLSDQALRSALAVEGVTAKPAVFAYLLNDGLEKGWLREKDLTSLSLRVESAGSETIRETFAEVHRGFPESIDIESGEPLKEEPEVGGSVALAIGVIGLFWLLVPGLFFKA